MLKKLTSMLLIFAIMTSFVISASAATTEETVITLSDSGVKVDGATVSTSSSSAVYVGADIVYYEAGHDSTYGEGTAADAHTAAEAKAHTVITITKAGTYRISGTLSAGQIAVDLGDSAKNDSTAVVTLILDGVDITCTVAPAVIFYKVYECGTVDAATATGTVDTSKAGANVILAEGSVNNVAGSYVARIYKEGTTSKLHKYDGAFYSKMSMNVSGETLGNGVLNITAQNEGLDSELHLTINGGVINITSQDDGINTNEDGVSVTTINGGTIYVNGGLGSEGDGIDSNGFLTINGGTVIALANPKTGDGGIDADGDITLNGGTVIALGSRNDAAASTSKQAYMELSYAATQAAGTIIRVEDASGTELLTFAPAKDYQSFTFSSSKLTIRQTYYVYSGGSVTGVTATNGLYASGGTYTGGTQQQYTGNSSGMMGGGGMGGQMTDGTGGTRPEGMTPPDGTEGTTPEGMTPPDGTTARPERTEGTGTPPEGIEGQGERPGGMEGQAAGSTDEGSVEFTLTATSKSFSGVSDSADASGKTAVTFSVNGGSGMTSVATGGTLTVSNITATVRTDGSAAAVPESDIQITITDVPSENYASTCLMSDGASALSAILPSDDGTYRLTVAVVGTNATYTGTSQWQFTIGTLPFTDITANDKYYEAIGFVYEKGLMSGTGDNTFSPSLSVTRAMSVTVLGRLAGAATTETTDFTDVAAGSWYSPYVGWAAKNSIVSGYGNGLYGPDDAVTRQQMCVIIANYMDFASIAASGSQTIFSDDSQIASWATEAVYACQAAGLLDGIVTGNALNPSTDLTRAELADVLMRLAEML